MKKKYVSPKMYAESLRINSTISTCITNISKPIEFAWYDEDPPDTVFGQDLECTYDYESGVGAEWLAKLCYNGPVNADMVFSS